MTARHRFDWRIMYLVGRMRRQQQRRVMVRLRCATVRMWGVWVNWLERFRWHYVGTVKGWTDILKEDGSSSGRVYNQYWILTQRSGDARRAKSIGEEHHSPLHVLRTAQVAAWLRGGPIPPLEDEFANGASPRGKLIMFNGGKGGDAV